MIFIGLQEVGGMDVHWRRQRFAEAVRTLRAAARESQASLASKAGVDLKTVQRIEKERLLPNLATVWGIAEALGVTTAELLGEATLPTSAASADDLSETVSRLGVEVAQNTLELRDTVARQSASVARVDQMLNEISARLDALERRRRKAG